MGVSRGQGHGGAERGGQRGPCASRDKSRQTEQLKPSREGREDPGVWWRLGRMGEEDRKTVLSPKNAVEAQIVI